MLFSFECENASTLYVHVCMQRSIPIHTLLHVCTYSILQISFYYYIHVHVSIYTCTDTCIHVHVHMYNYVINRVLADVLVVRVGYVYI